MGYITFTYRCSEGDHEEDRLVRREEQHNQYCELHPFQGPMTKLPAGTRTTFRYADTKLKP